MGFFGGVAVAALEVEDVGEVGFAVAVGAAVGAAVAVGVAVGGDSPVV